VEAALLGTAVDLGTAGADEETGAGLVRADAAVASVAAPVSDGVAPVVTLSGIVDGTVVRGTVTLAFTARDASPIVATRIYRDGRYYRVRRTATVSVAWRSAGVADGIHRWTGYATDSGLRVGSVGAHVLVANRREVGSVKTALLMTTSARSITRVATLSRSSPFVARFRGPAASTLRVRIVSSSGRVVADVRGRGTVAVALTSLRAGRYTIRAWAGTAVPGRHLRLSAGWLR
jgi:hypothetical protein